MMPARRRALLVGALVACASACGREASSSPGPPPDTTPPAVSFTAPGDNATGVPTNTLLMVAFSEAMDPSTVTSATFTVAGVSGNVTASSTTATFAPSTALAFDTLYVATLSTGVKDLAGNPLAAPHSWTFTTGAAPDVMAPTVSLTAPASDATGVPTNTTLVVAFSEAMDPSTLTSATFTVGGVSGTVIAGTTTATFTPSTALAFDSAYTATISTGVKDLAGNPLAAPYGWTFTTLPDPCLPELSCAAPSGSGGDEICIAGRVVDGADLATVIDSATAEKIQVRLYEALNFLADPTTLAFRTLTVGSGLDSCGRFTARFSTAGDAPNGFVTVVTAGRPGTASENDYILGTTSRRVFAGANLTAARAYLVTRAQDQAWSTAAGGLGGTTFAAVGTLAVRYHQGGTEADPIPGNPIRGIVPTWNGVTDASQDHFFSDSGSTTLQTIGPLMSSTGPDGFSFLTIGTSLGNVSAGSACITSGGSPGTLTVTGATLSGTTSGAIVFFNLEVICF